ncbi:MAG: adenylate/guanylate cyclase domain-containing protein [Dongiaceae bacterium]
MERKLTAILAADIAGYSRLMGADEEGTLDALRAHRDVVDGLVAAHRGRVFNSAGDSIVAEFPSAVEAINCAAEIQQEMGARNEPVAQDRRLEFRIGINIGDVMAEGGNLFGDGVNVAARVQELAEPGGICVARNVYDQVKQKVGVAFEPLGNHQVKNIAEPVAIYRVLTDGAAATSALVRWLHAVQRHRLAAGVLAVVLVVAGGGAAAWYLHPRAQAPARMPSVAVLPFDNLSGNPDLGYFSDGVSEDIITMLSRSPDLVVVARNSSFVYKGKAVDVRQVGKELGVEYVLEGSVRKEAGKVRIVAQLIDADTGQHVWADRYDKAGSDPWALQDDVTAKIVSSIAGERGQVRRAEYKQAWGKDTADLAEYDYYLRGHEFLMRFTREDHLKAGEIWREGLEKFPDSSLLRVKLGSFYITRAWNFWSDDAAADYRQGGELVRQGLAAPNVPPKAQQIGHWVLAFVCAWERDFERAEAEAQAAIQMAPYDANMLADLAAVPIMAGNPDRALDWVAQAADRDPGNVRLVYFSAWAHVVRGDYEKVISALNGRALSPDWPLLLAIAYVRLDRMDDARAAVKKALELDPQFTQATWQGGYFYSDPLILEGQLADLGKAGLPEK